MRLSLEIIAWAAFGAAMLLFGAACDAETITRSIPDCATWEARKWVLRMSSVPDLHMPSEEVCEQVRAVNPGASCWSTKETGK